MNGVKEEVLNVGQDGYRNGTQPKKSDVNIIVKDALPGQIFLSLEESVFYRLSYIYVLKYTIV